MSGVPRTSVPDANAYQDPNAPLKSAYAARVGSYLRTPRNSASTATIAAPIVAPIVADRIARGQAGAGVTRRSAMSETPANVESRRCRTSALERGLETPTAIRQSPPAVE